MSLIQVPGSNYRGEIKKGRFYICPAQIPPDSLVIVRPLYDDSSIETIPANIIPLSQCHSVFNHSGYPSLKLKPNEEFVVVKIKERRVVAITRPGNHGLLKVAPIYTLKDYHERDFDMDKLKNNQIAGIIYLSESDFNNESFISLMESFPTYTTYLKPIPLELNPSGLGLLDDNLVTIHDIYGSSL